MSDLAAFVAATIESKVVGDLKTENDKLREENDQLREKVDETRAAALNAARLGGSIVITGDGGFPTYAHGMLHTATCDSIMEAGLYGLDIELTQNDTCPISQVLFAEIHVNGVKLVALGDDCDDIDCPASEGDEYDARTFMFYDSRGTPWTEFFVDVRFGPIPPLGRYGTPHIEDLRDEDNIQEVTFPRFSFDISHTSTVEADLFHEIILDMAARDPHLAEQLLAEQDGNGGE